MIMDDSGSVDYSQEGSMTSTQQRRKKMKGLKKIGSSIRFAFGGGGGSGSGGGKKRGRRGKKKDGGGGMDSRSEDGSYSNSSSRKTGGGGGGGADDEYSREAAAKQREWIDGGRGSAGGGGGSGLTELAAIGAGVGVSSAVRNSAGGRGKSLTKITEEDHEDSTGDYAGDAAAFSRSPPRPTRRGVRPNKGGGALSPSSSSTVESASPSKKFGWRSGKSESSSSSLAPTVDPLSLVVLLVDPASLRFELLSLDFDLTAFAGGKKNSKKKKNKKRGGDGGGDGDRLTVQDVLDQIGPAALTDEKLRERVRIPGSCKGLIDRRGRIHFGAASLEKACASRPLRDVDVALRKNDPDDAAARRGSGSLSVPTYGGEPHRDVLLGFFGGGGRGKKNDHAHNDDDDDDDYSSISQETMAAVAKSLELARPIFADPNVIELMEKSGYDLVGWKTATGSGGGRSVVESTKLGKPVVPTTKQQQRGGGGGGGSALKRVVLGSLAVLLATVLAWSVVAGGLHLLPFDEFVGRGGEEEEDGVVVGGGENGPVTLEGYAAHFFHLARAWYSSTSATTTTSTATMMTDAL